MAIDLSPLDPFQRRHIGPDPSDIRAMIQTIGASSMEEFLHQVVPASIRLGRPMNLPAPLGEREALERLREIAGLNRVFRSLIGMGYADTITRRLRFTASIYI